MESSTFSNLQNLDLTAYNAEDLETRVINTVHQQIEETIKEKDTSKIESLKIEIDKLKLEIRATTKDSEERKLSKKLEKLEKKLKELEKTPIVIEHPLEAETETERLIRTGVMNPLESLENANKRKRTEVVIPLKKKTSSVKDDGDIQLYRNRMKDFVDDSEEFVLIDGGYSIPSKVYDRLYDYQKTSVSWLWQIHRQGCGGILCDEMGLGKTVQIAAFFAGLVTSNLYKPSIIVCPATVLNQWVAEIQEWVPRIRAVIFHETGTHEETDENIINSVADCEFGLLITTYETIRIKHLLLLARDWDYVVLDEGHKIRNPDSEITLTCKNFETFHRIILSGTPIQNNLRELWSLFDFVFPGKLGTLPVFLNQFAIPITQGGYVNAKQFDVETAYKCSVVLRNLISPYMLRRMKKDVLTLPKKSEQVLFTKLTDYQLEIYKSYLGSKDVINCFGDGDESKGSLFKAIAFLRKICNHPNLVRGPEETEVEPLASGKMLIVDKLLSSWKQENHRVLLYSQSVKMLDLLESYLKKTYSLLRMDGGTPISSRSHLIDKFNNDESVFVFLLTTKVGGIGINLTGADRVLIYDPDWNPSVDQQSLERSWRVGQTKDVHVYRLMTSGTIEEKMYHRQIFKNFLTNKILKDPRQTRFFKENDLKDLFQLGVEYSRNNIGTETGSIFKSSEVVHNDDGGDDGEKKGETHILKKLLDGDHVHSAFNHEEIISGKPEVTIVVKEAQKIAKGAVEALKESAKDCLESSIGTPTWTGSKGSAGRRFGSKSPSTPTSLSSQSIFNHLDTKNTVANLFGAEKKTKEQESFDLAKSLKEFIANQPDQRATTKDIVSHFKDLVKGEQVLMFKPLLREIAVMDKTTQKWRIK